MSWIKTLNDLESSGKSFAIATVSDIGGSAPREIGAKIIVLENGDFFHTIGGGELERQVIEQAKKCLLENKNGLFSYPLGAKTGQCCGGVVEVYIEVVHNNRPDLFIFGQGHVGLAIAKTLEDGPLQITGVDPRDEWLEKSKQFKINHLKLEVVKDIQIPTNSAAVVLTHSHDLDFDLVNHLCQRDDLIYIGMIGSESKWIRFQRRLKEAGRTPEEIKRITCPIGIPVPGKSPTEVAISFSAQILNVFAENKK